MTRDSRATVAAALAPCGFRLGHSDFLCGDESVYADYALGEDLVHLKHRELRFGKFPAV